ncbi:hypothetical protein BGW42_003949, partial [Actinomortierella wolfii]
TKTKDIGSNYGGSSVDSEDNLFHSLTQTSRDFSPTLEHPLQPAMNETAQAQLNEAFACCEMYVKLQIENFMGWKSYDTFELVFRLLRGGSRNEAHDKIIKALRNHLYSNADEFARRCIEVMDLARDGNVDAIRRKMDEHRKPIPPAHPPEDWQDVSSMGSSNEPPGRFGGGGEGGGGGGRGRYDDRRDDRGGRGGGRGGGGGGGGGYYRHDDPRGGPPGGYGDNNQGAGMRRSREDSYRHGGGGGGGDGSSRFGEDDRKRPRMDAGRGGPGPDRHSMHYQGGGGDHRAPYGRQGHDYGRH